MRALALIFSVFCIQLNTVYAQQANLLPGTYVSDKTKEILIVSSEDSLTLLSLKTKKNFIKKETGFYISTDNKDTLRFSVVGDIVRDNYLGIQFANNPKRMFDYFDASVKVPQNYQSFLKSVLQGNFVSFDGGLRYEIDFSSNILKIVHSPKKQTTYKIHSLDAVNHKLVLLDNKKKKQEVLFKLTYQNVYLEHEGKKLHFSTE